jgi:hypothetical protein
MSNIEEAEAENRARIDHLGQLLGQAGLQYSTLDRHPMGGGHVLAFAEDVIVAVTVNMYLGGQFSITYGVGRDLPRQRCEILEICNRHNQGMTAYPIHLHDADAGWDVLLTLTYPFQLFVSEPEFISGFALNASVGEVVGGVRTAFAEAGMPLVPYQWNSEDASRLQMRALI